MVASRIDVGFRKRLSQDQRVVCGLREKYGHQKVGEIENDFTNIKKSHIASLSFGKVNKLMNDIRGSLNVVMLDEALTRIEVSVRTVYSRGNAAAIVRAAAP